MNGSRTAGSQCSASSRRFSAFGIGPRRVVGTGAAGERQHCSARSRSGRIAYPLIVSTGTS